MAMQRFFHGPDLGDIIYALPIIRHMGGGILYICANTFKQEMKYQLAFDFFIDQPYIEDVVIVRNYKILKVKNIINLDGFRVGNWG